MKQKQALEDNSLESSKENKTSTVGFGEVSFQGEDIPSYVDKNGEPFYYRGINLIVTKVDGDEATIIHPNGYTFMNEDQKTTSFVTFNILLQDGKLKTTTINNKTYLYEIVEKKRNKILKVNLLDMTFTKGKLVFNYPLEIIKVQNKDYIVIEKNNAFYKCHDSEKNIPIILYKTGDNYVQTRLLSLYKSDELPLDNEMFILTSYSYWNNKEARINYGGDTNESTTKLIYWDDQSLKFELVTKGNLDYNWVKRDSSDHKKFILPNGRKFSISKDNPKEPAGVDINGNFILIEYEYKKNYVIIDGHKFSIHNNYTKIPNYIKINGCEFYAVTGNGGDIFYTDGKKIFNFVPDGNLNIKTFKYEGVDYPIINDKIGQRELLTENKDNKGVSICYIKDGKAEQIYLIKNEVKNNEDNENENSNEKNQIDYIRLKFSPEQKKLELVKISAKHGIVFLVTDTLNTSGYELYRINKDGTLSFVFKDIYNVSIDDNAVKIKSDRSPWYQLVRRPDTISIFEPIITNNHECLLAQREKSEKIICISLNKNLEISPENIEINSSTFLFANSFTFGEETLCYNKDGAIKIGDSYFNLVNQNGELVFTPEEAIYKIGDKELLLIARKILSNNGFKIDSILGYFPKIKKLEQINHLTNYIRFSSLTTSYNNTNTVQNAFVDGKEYICRSNSSKFRILGIIGIKEDGFSLRYVNKIEKNGKLEGEEFECNGEKIIIESGISKEYLRGQDGKIYYRPGFGNKITEIKLPENVKFDDSPYFEIVGFDHHFSLLMKEGKLVPISDKYNKYYRLESESLGNYRINGKNISIITLWDSENNRLISLKKTKKDYDHITIGGNHEICIGCGNWIIFYYHNSVDIKQKVFIENIDNIKIARLQGSIDDKDEEVLVIVSKNNKWCKVYDPACNTKYFCPIYKVGDEIIAVDLREKYSISFGKDLKIKINGINYDENMLNLIYEQNRPKGSVSTVVGKVKIKTKKATGVKD